MEDFTMTNTKKDIIERIVDELKSRFEKNNWTKLTLTMKPSGDEITIDPCFYDDSNKNAATVEFFLINSPSINIAGCDSIRELAYILKDYEADRKDTISNKDACKQFYDMYIAKYSSEEIRQACDYGYKLMTEWQKNHSDESIDAFRSNYDYTELDNSGQNDAKRIEELCILSHNLDTYSDWYKDLYGRRPQL